MSENSLAYDFWLMPFYELKKLLPKSIRRAGVGRQVEAVSALEIFSAAAREILGEEIAGQTKPLYFKNGIITVACLSSLIMQELQYREREIVEKINKQIGEDIIKKLNYAA